MVMKVALMINESNSRPYKKLLTRRYVNTNTLRKLAVKYNRQISNELGYGAYYIVIIDETKVPKNIPSKFLD